MIILESLPPEKCEQCGQMEELRPYGKVKRTGNRMWICFDCGMKDQPTRDQAFQERLDGKNLVTTGEST